MSEAQRYRSGPQQVASGLIKAGIKAQVGDLMFLSSDEYLYPASTIAVDGSGSGSGGGFSGGSALTDFKGAFAGTLIEGATTGNEATDSNCLYGYDATYEYPLNEAADATYPSGTPILPVEIDDVVADQVVAIGSARTNAIGLASREIREGDLTVQFRTVSSIMGAKLVT